MFSPDQAVRRDGAPQEFANSAEPLRGTVEEGSQAAPAKQPAPALSIASLLGSARRQCLDDDGGKADRLVVNRTSKGSL